MMTELTHYFVTDIECDGPDPSRNSMLSFASVASTMRVATPPCSPRSSAWRASLRPTLAIF